MTDDELDLGERILAGDVTYLTGSLPIQSMGEGLRVSWLLANADELLTLARRGLAAKQDCPVHSKVCLTHGYVHGAEAEELRTGIEHLISVGHTACYDLRNDLQDLLDSIDARDSLAFREAKEGG